MPLARQLNVFDATMIVMGGIVGSGIFMNPYVVAQSVHSPALILGLWLFGGFVAVAGAFVYADLAAVNGSVGGQYAYLRDGWHPSVAFLYGWCLLLVIQTGGMAAVAVTFANYLIEMTGIGLPAGLIAALTLLILGGINILGVRAGSTTQNILMALKIVAIGMLVAAGFLAPHAAAPHAGTGHIDSLGGALTPVLFAYGGWQTASFLSGEMKNTKRDLPRGVILGVSGVVILYLAVNWVCVRALGPDGLAHTPTPASAVMRLAFGETGGRLMAAGIAISTLGFLSQGMLTAPRIYYAMANDGLFFRRIGTLNPRTQAPAAAIALQAVLALIIAFSGSYGRILNYVTSIDFIFFGLTGAAALRMKAGQTLLAVFFVAACWTTVLGTIVKDPGTSSIGLALLAAGVPVYYLWAKKPGVPSNPLI
jgi:APA family basic amino acid/polyamine antiporter